MAVSAAFSAIFIARTTFVVDGTRYFTLFDDAMVSMRYARNFAGGHGLVWNAGQPAVEGYTNFLWTLWMAILHLLPVGEEKISLLVMLSGAAILAVNLGVVSRIAARLAPGSPRAALVASWLTALYYPLIYWTLRGMEVGLITLMLSTSVLLALRLADRFSRRDSIALAWLMAAGVLTRPDVIVPCAVVAAFVVWSAESADRRRIAVMLAAAVGGTFALQTGFRLWYYGDPLPNTYYLKVAGAPLSARLARGMRVLLGIGVLHLLVPVALAGGYVVTRARQHAAARAIYLLAALFLAACAYCAYVGGDAWDSMLYANRYVTPAMPLLLILTALALDDLVRRHSQLTRWTLAPAGLFVLTSALTTAAPIVTHGLAATRADQWLKAVRVGLMFAPVIVLPMMPRARLAGLVTLTASTLVAVNGLAYTLWLNHNAFFAADDAWATRYGLALRSATAADATIGVTWAGAIPYFSHRPTVDLLGKSDRVVARRPRQAAVGFEPGHDKWDYEYSVGEVRPDLVAQLWHASDRDRLAIQRSGYDPLGPWLFARADTTRVDRRAVRDTACAILRDDPFVLGSTTRTPVDGADLVARYCRE